MTIIRNKKAKNNEIDFENTDIKKQKILEKKIIDIVATKDEEILDNDFTLRPKFLNEYIGQKNLKSNLKVFIEAAKKRGESLEHMLFYGPPGLGKTTISLVIANEMGVNIKEISGPAIEKSGDIAGILTNLKKGDVLFIDEIHRLKSNIEELLYSALEDYKIDIMIGKGPSSRVMRIDLPKFTLIGATTKLASLSSPLRDRFGHISKLDFYDDSEMRYIILRSSALLNLKIEEESIPKIILCSKQTPRIANKILKRLRDFADVQNNSFLDKNLTTKGLKLLGFDENGLDQNDRKFLEILVKNFAGGPVGLSTLSSALAEDKKTIEDVYEPYLIKLGFLKKSTQGRLATRKAFEYFGI